MPGLCEYRSMTDPLIRTLRSLGELRAVSCIRPSSRLFYVHRSNDSPYGASLPPWCCCIAHTDVHTYISTFPSLLSVVLSLSSSLVLTRTTRPTELATPCLARPAGGQKRGRPGAALPLTRSSCCAYLRPQGQIRRAVPAVPH